MEIQRSEYILKIKFKIIFISFFISVRFLIIFYFSITVYIQYYVCIIIVSGLQHNDYAIIYFTKYPPQYFHYPLGTICSYYSIIGDIPYAVLYIPITILKLPICTSQSFLLFHPVPPNPSPLAAIILFSVSMSLFPF